MSARPDFGLHGLSRLHGGYRAFGRLRRDTENGLILGVCAGLAGHFGLNVATLRVLAVLALVLMTELALVCYLVAGVLMPAKRLTYHGRSEQDLWRRRNGGRIHT
jgi:phage shock protein C